MAQNREYYETRMNFIVESLTDGTISRGDLIKNKDRVMIIMKNYWDEHGAGNSSLSFTILQDQIFGN